ncbi:DUF6660 family protein [Rufibacter latericius]|uniref:DUF6660 family protein n=1 Tax=Rufibacter latericius TaxID=2487040 RepID=UPI002939062D|nr:DUF6660 family protein [Rufibacter latericius]
MKWFAILLSVFMTVMSCIPCADAAPRVDTPAQTSINPNTDSEDHSPAADLCSPLCICSCCAGFALQAVTQKASPLAFKVTIPVPVHRVASVPTLSFSIWQPPKL